MQHIHMSIEMIITSNTKGQIRQVRRSATSKIEEKMFALHIVLGFSNQLWIKIKQKAKHNKQKHKTSKHYDETKIFVLIWVLRPFKEYFTDTT